MNVTIVGLGLIGGSLALELKAKGFASKITGVDASPEHLKIAKDLKLVDETRALNEALAGADLVILAIPVSTVYQILPDILSQLSDTATLTDMGSTKEKICAQVSSHPKRAQFVASHPMAGTEFSGPTAAIRGLFVGKAAVICEKERSASQHLQCVEKMYSVLQMRLIYMKASEHDLHTAYVSHLSHISSFVLANTILEKEKDVDTIFDLASGGFESTVRLAKSSPEMWAPIFEQNQARVSEALTAYIEQLEDFRKSLDTGNFSKTKTLMERANQIRRVLSRIRSKTLK